MAANTGNASNGSTINVENRSNITHQYVMINPPAAERLPEKWKIPLQLSTPDFVGRTQERKALNDLFKIRKTCCVLISAIGGQGKTFLVKKFIQELLEDKSSFHPVVWLNGETIETLAKNISQYMEEIPHGRLPIVDSNNQSISASYIIDHMIDPLSNFAHKTTKDGWIVVIDNADKIYPEFENIVDKFYQCGSFIIITSRETEILKEVEHIPLQGLEPDAASSLVKLLLPETNETDILQLCKELENYPLGIRQAVAYIKLQPINSLYSKYGVNNFIHDLKNAITKVVSQNNIRDYGRSILAIVDLTLEKIKSEENGAGAIKVLKILSLVNADGVTIDHLGWLVKNCFKIEHMEPPLLLLKKICFVEVSTSEESSISIHRVVQTIVRDKMKAKKEVEKLLNKLLDCHEYLLVGSLVSSLDRNQILHLTQIWQHSFEYCNLVKDYSDMATNIFNRLLNLTLYPELRQFTEGIAGVLPRTSSQEEIKILWMEYCACLGLETTGEYEKALEQYEIIRKKQVEHAGQYHPHTLLTQEQIASTLCRMKKWNESLTKHREVYSLMLKHLPKDHSHTRITQHNIAICLKEMGEFDEALLLFQDVYDFRKKSYGATSSWTLDTRSHIADIWFQKKEFEKAKLEYEEVYNLSKTEEGELHENTIKAMKMLEKCREQEG